MTTAIPSQPAPHAAGDPLTRIFHDLCELHAAAPFQPLSDHERSDLGGHLFPGAPAVVAAVAEALHHRELFPDLTLPGEVLGEQQRAALRWLMVRDLLRDMAQRAADTYLKVQGQAVRLAMGAVRQVRAQPVPFGMDEETAALRALAILPAFYFVADYHQRLERSKAQAKRRRQAQREAPARAAAVSAASAPPAPVAPAAAPPIAAAAPPIRAAAPPIPAAAPPRPAPSPHLSARPPSPATSPPPPDPFASPARLRAARAARVHHRTETGQQWREFLAAAAGRGDPPNGPSIGPPVGPPVGGPGRGGP